MNGADDPAYRHELGEVARQCRAFLAAHERDDFPAQLFTVGLLVAHCAALWKLSPPAGLFDPAELFRPERPPE